MKYSKVFVIGFNKTATTTIHKLYQLNNLKSQHATKWEPDNYDCFSDNGNLNDFKELDNLYEDSIFILNTRNLANWLYSRFKHGHRQFNKDVVEQNMNKASRSLTKWLSSLFKQGHSQCDLSRQNKNWAYPCTTELALEWIKDRENYYLQVLDYFKDRPNKLIILSIEHPNWKKFISSELEINNIDFKNRNVIELHDIDYDNRIENCINEAFAKINYTNEQRNAILLMSAETTNKYLLIYKNNINL